MHHASFFSEVTLIKIGVRTKMKGKGNHFALTNKFLQIKFNRPLWNSQFLTAIIPIYNRSLWKTGASKFPLGGKILYSYFVSLRASSPIWASEASLARTRKWAAKPRGAGERRACNHPLQIFICTSPRRREISLAEKWRSGNQSWLITG